MNGHPWHPAMVHFPLACWVLATLIDIASQFFALPAVPGIAWPGLTHLLLWAGIVLAVPAMIAGLLDYGRLPPPVQESAELSSHIIAMTTAWAIFLGAAIWRVQGASFDSAASWGVSFLELAGLVCLAVGGRLAAVVVFERLPAALNASPSGRERQAGVAKDD